MSQPDPSSIFFNPPHKRERAPDRGGRGREREREHLTVEGEGERESLVEREREGKFSLFSLGLEEWVRCYLPLGQLVLPTLLAWVSGLRVHSVRGMYR